MIHIVKALLRALVAAAHARPDGPPRAVPDADWSLRNRQGRRTELPGRDWWQSR